MGSSGSALGSSVESSAEGLGGGGGGAVSGNEGGERRYESEEKVSKWRRMDGERKEVEVSSKEGRGGKAGI